MTTLTPQSKLGVKVGPFLTQDMWRIEPAGPGDIPFIIDSWCSDEAVHVSRKSNEDPDIFKAGQRGRVLRLLSNCPGVVIRLTPYFFSSHPKADSRKDLAAWCLYSIDRATLYPIIHFMYTKVEYRSQGLTSPLLYAAGIRPDKPAWCTHDRMRLGKAMKARGIMYNRYLLDYDPAYRAPARGPL